MEDSMAWQISFKVESMTLGQQLLKILPTVYKSFPQIKPRLIKMLQTNLGVLSETFQVLLSDPDFFSSFFDNKQKKLTFKNNCLVYFGNISVKILLNDNKMYIFRIYRVSQKRGISKCYSVCIAVHLYAYIFHIS